MFKKILIALIIIIAGFALIVAMQPSEFRVTRPATIAAATKDLFAQVNDFHNWEAWSPWAKLDPEAKITFEGAAAGTGAICTWSGNDKVGEGRMTLVESRPDELVRIQLEFVKPLASKGTSEFTFKPQGDQTEVTWTMSGQNNFIGKAICLFMNMDKTVGANLEKGLAQLKSVVEAGAKK
jgi:hypothetical protein